MYHLNFLLRRRKHDHYWKTTLIAMNVSKATEARMVSQTKTNTRNYHSFHLKVQLQRRQR